MPLAKILWVDDEIESLQSQKLFLEHKGYNVITCTNGFDALEYVKSHYVDVVLIDESMPGITGLETLARIKAINRQLPIVLITKNETENLMNEAIGSQISDYLIKPVNPNQVWLSLKKLIDNKRLVAEKTTTSYQQNFRELFMALSDNPNHQEWMEIYKRLVHWELEMEKSDSPEMQEIFNSQKQEANTEFFKFISRNYANWVKPTSNDAPIMSNHLLQFKVLPHTEQGAPVFFILIDNLRFDQWKAIAPLFAENFRILEEESFYSILPTATQYCRNAIFAGLMPVEIEKQFPGQWKNDEEEGGKNLFEEDFFRAQLKRLKKDNLKISYTKVVNHHDGQALVNNIHNMLNNDLNIIVYNFVDMLSHARTEMEIIRELAEDEAAYRSITQSWFEHSPLLDIIKYLSENNIKVIITTDHGTVHVKQPIKITGDKNITTNLRYKTGKSIDYNKKDVFEVRNPQDAFLPKQHVSSIFIFAKEDDFFAYANNFNHYANYYKNTFQHGGISLEEMIIPIITLSPKN